MGNNLETIVYLLNSLDLKRRNHIIGGVLLGVSMFFGVLSITILTTKAKEIETNEQ
jgi:hypothetical protein